MWIRLGVEGVLPQRTRHRPSPPLGSIRGCVEYWRALPLVQNIQGLAIIPNRDTFFHRASWWGNGEGKSSLNPMLSRKSRARLPAAFSSFCATGEDSTIGIMVFFFGLTCCTFICTLQVVIEDECKLGRSRKNNICILQVIAFVLASCSAIHASL